MLSGLPILMLATAQAAATAPPEPPAAEQVAVDRGAYGPALPPKPKPKVRTAAANDACKPTEPKDVEDDTREIVVCAQRVEGYRIDPDVMKAQRIKRKNGKARGPERLVDNSCGSVGPMGCRGGAGINLVAAAITAATMLQKAASGENVGEMFITDPQTDEYQLYVQAKREREANEAEQAAAAKAKAADEAAEAAAAR
jgi:hypothetical protein